MRAINFEKAIHIAQVIITSQHKLPADLDTTSLRGLSAKRAANIDRSTSKRYFEFQAELYGADLILDEYDQAVEGAAVNYLCFTALCRGIATALETNTPLPPKIAEWHLRYLRGEVHPPKRGRGQPAKDARSLKIFHAVQYLVQQGMKPTRNDESKHDIRQSACDAVAEALKRMRTTPSSYKRVQEIYQYEKGDGRCHVIVAPETAELF